ncbi:VOC family protein [Pseudonocardia humida]|uniref:VOC family protein n=1 Tax=Pseudonocardia humida TaxID=2800819 RepID=A0ABT1AA98_9PSEU|nr:VOC family protein [Pseudonocardia humida]MCO1659569.1 VOC family protein [Pseudonocardia humida]
MPVRDTPWPAGTPCWVDVAVPDVTLATAFYSAVLGWSFIDSGEAFGNYHVAQVDGRAAAAIGPAAQGDAPPRWTVYLATDDADATAKLITEHGGSLLVEPADVAGNGRMAVALDPTGGAFGVWQSAGMIGFGITAEPGAVTWTDARLSDVERGKGFFAAVFGHAFEPVPDAPGGYANLLVAGEPVGGIVGTPGGVPSHWLTYFSVADVDAAEAVAARAGAAVLMPAEDTPFGRMGIFTDPFGATFALHQALEG